MEDQKSHGLGGSGGGDGGGKRVRAHRDWRHTPACIIRARLGSSLGSALEEASELIRNMERMRPPKTKAKQTGSDRFVLIGLMGQACTSPSSMSRLFSLLVLLLFVLLRGRPTDPNPHYHAPTCLPKTQNPHTLSHTRTRTSNK